MAEKKSKKAKAKKTAKAFNFKKMKVSEKRKTKVKRVPSGINGFDKMIGGGFEKNSTNLIVGGSGSGKSIFGVQFLLEGVKRNENVMYVTFEEQKQEFYENMKGIGWDLESLEKKGKFFFVQYTPEKVKAMLEEGGGIIENLIIRKKIQRVVIDSITSFGLLFENDVDKREAALALFNMLRKWDCTTILTYERDVIKDRKTTSRILEFESDSIILLYFPRNKNKRERYLEVLKMRGTEHSLSVYRFQIKKKGIFVGKSFSGEITD